MNPSSSFVDRGENMFENVSENAASGSILGSIGSNVSTLPGLILNSI